jgi:hypothetical protein
MQLIPLVLGLSKAADVSGRASTGSAPAELIA